MTQEISATPNNRVNSVRRSRSVWSPEERARLFAYYANCGPASPPPRIPGKSADAVRYYAKKIGLFVPVVYKFWRTNERRIIKEHYPQSGVKGCMGMLPDRSLQAIEKMAKSLGFKPPEYGRRKQPTLCKLIAKFLGDRRDVDKTMVADMATEFGASVKVVEDALAKANLTRPVTRRNWLAKEDKILLQNHADVDAAWRSLNEAGFVRSARSIKLRLRRIYPEDDANAFTIAELSGFLGVPTRTINNWRVQKKLLTSETVFKNGAIAWQPSDVKKFLVSYPNLWDIQKTNKYFLITVMTDKL